jgi:cytoskeletal protein CcmA (bactofilin family)
MAKKISYKTKKIDTYIGIESHIKGDIVSEKSISIDGKVDGNITCRGEVIIGTNAIIIGNVKAFNVNASGYIKGNIDADDFIKLTTTCKVEGDICAKSFIADEGAVFNGVCNMCSKVSEKEINQK